MNFILVKSNKRYAFSGTAWFGKHVFCWYPIMTELHHIANYDITNLNVYNTVTDYEYRLHI